MERTALHLQLHEPEQNHYQMRRSSGASKRMGDTSLGNQKWEERAVEAPEQFDDDDEEEEEEEEASENWVIRLSSSSSERSSPRSTKRESDPAIPEQTKGEPMDPLAREAENETRYSMDDTEGSFGDDATIHGDGTTGNSVEQRVHDQLRVDMEVLVAHLQQQTFQLDHERATNQSLLAQLEHTKESMTREMESIWIENDALRRQNALVAAERDQSLERAQLASETHEELLRALRHQQQREDHARTIIAGLVKDRDAQRKQLDESKTYCRRLEEDVVSLRAEQQHLQTENKSLQTMIQASSTQKNTAELKIIHGQEQMIQSLRADLLQMEFEFKTLSVDKDKLNRTVANLRRQSECRSTSYDVISLKADDTKKHKKKLTVITSATTSSKCKGNGAGGSGDDLLGGFTNLMTLPNCVTGDGEDAVAAATAAASGQRARTPMGSLVSKTLSSARKKLFQSSSLTSTVVIPQ